MKKRHAVLRELLLVLPLKSRWLRVHLPTVGRWTQWTKTLNYFSSCHICALLVLSHFSQQSVEPIQHGSTSFLASYRRGINERWDWDECKKLNRKKNETADNSVKLKLKRKPQFFCKTEPKPFCQPHSAQNERWKNAVKHYLSQLLLKTKVNNIRMNDCSPYSPIHTSDWFQCFLIRRRCGQDSESCTTHSLHLTRSRGHCDL